MTVDPSMQEALRAAALEAGTSSPSKRGGAWLGHVLHWLLGLAGAGALFVGYAHFSANGQSLPAYGCLGGAAWLVLNPVRALLHKLFSLNRGVMHLAHLAGGLGLAALPLTGAVSGTSLMTHAALAPFSMMGAAQALMHANQPRNAAQAAALRSFVTSLPEVEQFTRSGDFTSPANVARAAAVLGDLISKAQVLGETELQSDPNFQSAWKQVGVRAGLNLGLDTIDHSIEVMAKAPGGAAAAAALRARVAQARGAIAKPTPAPGANGRH